MIEIHRYTTAYHRDWNDFVSESSNSTFLFLREYMEYHADRFTDYSLLVYDGNKLLALLPANRSGDVLYSHRSEERRVGKECGSGSSTDR